MKIIVSMLLVASLTGCAAIDKVKQVWPRDHDSALVSSYVSLSIYLEKASCAKDSKENTLKEARLEADWLNRYAEFRNDPQKISTKAIVDNLEKAINSEAAACQRWLNLSKTRMKIIQEAWSGR